MNKSYPPNAFTKKIKMKAIDKCKIADIHLNLNLGEKQNKPQHNSTVIKTNAFIKRKNNSPTAILSHTNKAINDLTNDISYSISQM